MYTFFLFSDSVEQQSRPKQPVLRQQSEPGPSAQAPREPNEGQAENRRGTTKTVKVIHFGMVWWENQVVFLVKLCKVIKYDELFEAKNDMQLVKDVLFHLKFNFDVS